MSTISVAGGTLRLEFGNRLCLLVGDPPGVVLREPLGLALGLAGEGGLLVSLNYLSGGGILRLEFGNRLGILVRDPLGVMLGEPLGLALIMVGDGRLTSETWLMDGTKFGDRLGLLVGDHWEWCWGLALGLVGGRRLSSEPWLTMELVG
jgi:hypothetical protein